MSREGKGDPGIRPPAPASGSWVFVPQGLTCFVKRLPPGGEAWSGPEWVS